MKTWIGIKMLFCLIAGMNMLIGYSQNTGCNLTLTFTTVSTEAGFAPKNVLAVWVEDNSNTFIRSLKVLAGTRKQYLYTWNDESAGNTVDAVTGATRNSHSAETVNWNGKNTSQVVVPDGTYKLFIEFTEEHSQGPVLIIPFIKSTTNSDSSFANQTNFINVALNYAVGGVTGIDEQLANSESLNVFPNPVNTDSEIKIRLDKAANAHLSLYSLNGQCLFDAGILKLNEGENSIRFSQYFNENELVAGTYLLRLEYDNHIKITKLIKP